MPLPVMSHGDGEVLKSDVYTRVPVSHTCMTCCNYVYTCVGAYMHCVPVVRMYAIPVRNRPTSLQLYMRTGIATCTRMHITEQGGVANDDAI